MFYSFRSKEGTETIHTHLEVTEVVGDIFDFCCDMTDEQDARARALIERAAAKWPLRILHVLSDAGAPLRFSRLMERVEGISQKVLTQTLRTLESDGLIIRTLYPQVPPRVEYELTPLGRDLLIEVATLWRWIVERLGDFDARKAAKLAATSA
ncbi:winged helix-turn-helix transcriptional regulator [Rhizobium binae]|uniref:winged helix-turn-helix transcriptional regulator n=1 Tax=Rhizobium binae TaxID=1138190 RepID=UPI001441A1D6|nr:helix-turn-helix domain-containing protein [Rhizobium binae]NKL50001.1 transcriptional regulator [Rhizobium leguminosarum bv. viciae]MBX4925204.1 helix-turn-helix transcriptional regulator [Rhizobium binae]MBX4941486.1 helix-turn-helix transcriptional regulator [Rhizobium binae]MBX4947501.1 helix-turn-helix transcriptional regulator [Rhizobium binae]MBX4948184.1 helix-turn-helix transcriptional regulator [Rhizobium binae]